MTTDFGTWIRAELNRRGWSQATLATRAGLSRSSISKMLTIIGRRKPSMKFFVGLAAAFELSVVEVIVIWEAGQGERESGE
jgi:transcriptional regulator with XRE-family HTH domain